MFRIEEFPDDERWWVVRKIDGFEQGLGRSRTPGVKVMLSALAATSQAAVERMTLDEIRHYVRGFKDGPKPDLHIARIHPTLLPLFGIGAVFHRRLYAGHLKTEARTITLTASDLRGRDVVLNPPIPADQRTGNEVVLQRSEYAGIIPEFSRSRFLIHSAGDIQYIIPRTEIHRRFYAPHSELARAFLDGPWNETVHRIVSQHDYKSGLSTGCFGGEWHLILQRRIRDDYARLVAFLYFDPYARTCANEIYSQSLVDRGFVPEDFDEDGRLINRDKQGLVSRPWFSSARIPFHCDAGPLQMTVRGWFLGPHEDRFKPGEKRKMLVTAITGMKRLPYEPIIRIERDNSGLGSDNPQPAPDTNNRSLPETRPAQPKVEITSQTDADANKQSVFALTDSFAWDAEDLPKLVKERHQVGVHWRSSSNQEGDPDVVSGGAGDYSTRNPPQINVGQIHANAAERFGLLITALDDLQKRGAIESTGLVFPPDDHVFADRQNLRCWTFLSSSSSLRQGWPDAGWVYVLWNKGKGASRNVQNTPRAALVVGITCGGVTGYWIEIEPRATEKGFSATIVLCKESDRDDAIDVVLEVLADRRGDDPCEIASPRLDQRGLGTVFSHRHPRKQASPLDYRRWICRLLDRYGLVRYDWEMAFDDDELTQERAAARPDDGSEHAG